MEYAITALISTLTSLLISFLIGKFYYSFNSNKIKEDYKQNHLPQIITRQIISDANLVNIPHDILMCEKQYNVELTNPLVTRDSEYNKKINYGQNLLLLFTPIKLSEMVINQKKLLLLIDNTCKSACQIKTYVDSQGTHLPLNDCKENYIKCNSQMLLIFDAYHRPQQLILDIGDYEATYSINTINEISYNVILKRKNNN